ncbi:hypothetical protein HHI36_017662 [Cryptolaemus montrouzieri]|uniref:Endonuclease n=1 Tax=Cryptolaemus montrouzieri TaxID=559131 RepID=A0ABD2NN84_9CUCU
MQRQAYKNLFYLGGFGVSCFFSGVYFQKRYTIEGCDLKNYPALPIFGTVSAATPFTPQVTEQKVSVVNRVSQIMKYGFPSLDNIRSFEDYVLSYDRRNRVANWVFEHLTAEKVKHNPEVTRATCEFKPDESIHTFFRSQNSDYKKSGFDRGHLAAAGNHKSHQKHIEETFFLSNIAPQVAVGFNRDYWNSLEKYVRNLTKVYRNVYCCTGPLYLPQINSDGKKYVKYQVIGENNVAVPTHFYKIVVGESEDGKLDMEAYCLPNTVISADTPLTSFRVPPESIERAAGLLFFDNLSRSKLCKINGKKN